MFYCILRYFCFENKNVQYHLTLGKSSIDRLLILVFQQIIRFHTFSVSSLQLPLNKLRRHKESAMHLSNANLARGHKEARCYELLERFIDIMERRQSNGGQQRHYPFRHPKWRYPYLEGPSTRPCTPTRSLLLQIHSHSNLANR